MMIYEDKCMASPNSLLSTLCREQEFLENGGYGDSPKRWSAPLIFEDGPHCLQPSTEAKSMCSLCPLIGFVPLEHRTKPVPCRHIALTEDGQTIESMYQTATQDEIEQSLRAWLQRRIAEAHRSCAERARLSSAELCKFGTC
jgi:hypothetical protein